MKNHFQSTNIREKIIGVHVYSPFEYINGFSVPKESSKEVFSGSATKFFCIPWESINSYVLQTNNIYKKREDGNRTSADDSNGSHAQKFLHCLVDAYPMCFKDIQSVLASLAQMQEKSARLNSLLVCQEKLSEISTQINTLFRYHIKCVGWDVSQSDVFLPDDLRADPSVCKRGLVYTETGVRWNCNAAEYFLPSKSSFYWGDVRLGLQVLSSLCKRFMICAYDTVVIDPPWQNKSVTRSKSYQTNFKNSELVLLGPYLKSVMNTRGCLVGVWITNSNKLLNFVKNDLFPHWGIQFMSIWYWLKVKNECEVLHPHPFGGKKTYERCVIGFYSSKIRVPQSMIDIDFDLDDFSQVESECKKRRVSEYNSDNSELHNCMMSASLFHEKCDGMVFSSVFKSMCSEDALKSNEVFPFSSLAQPESSRVKKFPIQVIVSVPVRHSWKPPLQNMLHCALLELESAMHDTYPVSKSEVLLDNGLELFAREVREKCTSIGNEVLLFQTIGTENNGDCVGFLKENI